MSAATQFTGRPASGTRNSRIRVNQQTVKRVGSLVSAYANRNRRRDPPVRILGNRRALDPLVLNQGWDERRVSAQRFQNALHQKNILVFEKLGRAPRPVHSYRQQVPHGGG